MLGTEWTSTGCREKPGGPERADGADALQRVPVVRGRWPRPPRLGEALSGPACALHGEPRHFPTCMRLCPIPMSKVVSLFGCNETVLRK
jgi:hypothetical protein